MPVPHTTTSQIVSDRDSIIGAQWCTVVNDDGFLDPKMWIGSRFLGEEQAEQLSEREFLW